MSKFAYFIINFLIVVFPVIFTLDRRINFFKKLKFVFLTSLIAAIPFIIHDIVFTKLSIWNFNPEFISGIHIINLPIEEILFFFAVPYSCLFIYESCKYFYSEKKIQVESSAINNFVKFFLGVALLFLFHTKVYTGIICLATAISLYCFRNSELFRSYSYWRYIFLSLIGFLLINFLLTFLPVVIYNSEYITNIRILSIPIEDFLYFWNMNTLILFIYNRLQSKQGENV